MVVIKFITPFSCLTAGSSGSGKTRIIFDILKHSDVMFTEAPVEIMYAYGAWQNKFTEMQQTIPNFKLFNNVPSFQDIQSWATDGKHRVLVLDDVFNIVENDRDSVDLFTKHSHHMNISVFFIVQNLFSGGKYFRTISLQAHYFIIFKNRRDENSIHTFSRQLFPLNSAYFLDAYKQATKEKYSYILIDISPHSNPEYSLRSHILPGEVLSIFVKKKT